MTSVWLTQVFATLSTPSSAMKRFNLCRPGNKSNDVAPPAQAQAESSGSQFVGVPTAAGVAANRRAAMTGSFMFGGEAGSGSILNNITDDNLPRVKKMWATKKKAYAARKKDKDDSTVESDQAAEEKAMVTDALDSGSLKVLDWMKASGFKIQFSEIKHLAEEREFDDQAAMLRAVGWAVRNGVITNTQMDAYIKSGMSGKAGDMDDEDMDDEDEDEGEDEDDRA